MGNIIWYEYARLVSVTASVYVIWAGFWGIFYRKFFWDFVGGVLRDPGGIQHSPWAVPFIVIIVKIPGIQLLAIALGLFIIAVEFPLPHLKRFAIYRSTTFRIVLLIFQTLLGILFYQGTNGALWSFIATMCYTRSLISGEIMEEAKENQGKASGV